MRSIAETRAERAADPDTWDDRWATEDEPMAYSPLEAAERWLHESDITVFDDYSAAEIAAAALREYGVEIALPWGPALGVLLAEAVNLAAKTIRMDFYVLKPVICSEVAGWPGVLSGWGDDGAFYLSASGAGTVSFHDPNDEITAGGYWPHPWSGIVRQEYAFDCLADHPVRQELCRLTSVSEAETDMIAEPA